MITFLNYIISLHFLLNSPEPRTFILGNTSADMDSVISSLAMAYSFTINKGDRSYIPVINCSPAELFYRFDIIWLLKNEGVDLSALVYADGLNTVRLGDEIVLVDHNAIDRVDLADYVTGVLDHHLWVNANRRHILNISIRFPRASAMSIVLEDFILPFGLDHEFSLEFLVAALLQDSGNFNEEKLGKKWVELDREIVHRLNRSNVYDLKTIFDKLMFEKTDVNNNLSIGLNGLINKDKKTYEYHVLGEILFSSYSVFHISFEDFSTKFTYNELVDATLDYTIGVFQFPKSASENFLIISTPGRQLAKQIVSCFDQNFETKNDTMISEFIYSLELHGNFLSRKLIEPALRLCIDDIYL